MIDELLAGARTEEELVGPGGLLADLTRRLVKRALSAELTDHLGYEPHQEPPGGTDNARNGTTPNTLVTEHGPVPIKASRDRKGTFDAEDCAQGPAPLPRLRRQDPRALCARPVDTRH